MTGELTDKTSQSYRWWFESHNSTSGTSPWLQSTLSDLELKTKAILDIIEGDADSFAQRAEMYYTKRPQLVSMVEDLCRAQKSLAEQFDRLMHRRSLLSASSIPFPISSANSKLVSDPIVEEEEEDINLISSFKKDGSKTATVSLDESNVTELSNDEYSEGESCDSEVDDPVPELIIQAVEARFDEGSGFAFGEDMMFSYDMDDVKGVREKLERLQEENETQKNQLNQKEREIELMKREVSEKGNEMMVIRKELERLRLEVYLLKRKRDVLERDTAETPKNQLSKKEREIEKVDEMMDIRNELEKLKRTRYVNETETAGTQVCVTRLSTEIEMQHRNQNSCLRLQLNEREYEIRELRRQIVAEKMNKRLLQEQIQDVLSSESELLKQKDEEKREVIRQMSLAIEMLKDENLFLKKQHSHTAIARQHSNKNSMPKIRNHLRNSQAFKGLPKFFHHWSLFGQASVVPL